MWNQPFLTNFYENLAENVWKVTENIFLKRKKKKNKKQSDFLEIFVFF